MTRCTHVIWDWNGTLLDDVAWCMTCINAMLQKRGLPILGAVAEYRRVFGFPVRDYYRRVGFDFETEPFETLAAEYMALYHGHGSSLSLFPGAATLLAALRLTGVRQILLSASEQANLLSQMKPFNLDSFFDEILGLPDIFAASKAEMGKAYVQRAKPGKAVLIGDTTHDKEVADSMGIACILVANGHQSKETLLSCNALVVDCLTDVVRVL